MLKLFDYYSQESKDLEASLEAAGFNCPTVVIEPDGFLPDGVLSPFTYFLNLPKKQAGALFFNQVELPPFWEITADSQAGRILCLGQERGRIHYADQEQIRLVKQVDWLDKKDQVRLSDHYDCYGNRFAQTSYTSQGQPMLKTYFSADGQERIVENMQTGDLIVTLEGEASRFFKNRVDFLLFFLRQLDLNLDHILFNSLSTSFFVSYALPAESGQDYLFWQEPLYDELPGNMRLILEQDLRAKKIIIPDKATYERALQLLGDQHGEKLLPLGYHYQFQRDNFLRPTAMILTYSDQISHLDYLLKNLPDLTFRIAAPTEMSPQLLSLLKYKNLVLYQNVSSSQVKDIFQASDIYLDINQGNEVNRAIRTAFENNLLLLGFEERLHDARYLASENIFSESRPEELVQRIRLALSGLEGMREALLAQGRKANDIPLSDYRASLAQLLGGADD
ncbi:accessory Sec system glycosylation chaperone GtfB [Streptococcus oricebi]|uniref:UDP-N-acetylglucosamine--peptide N-acetylglucosaminyltransferase stabilizing protein GtfB n=1 Tax=Streptococcus oricebi TaxID=1547447 RepID=A0ABS5B2D7_9STRE|nr:accessory Sec system glycosylation chaperone GtfB [Streptococcus oricebi]MBP2622972.1 accessory Sec system glycosylation chaperone GtfB [Streptococcus oricebi]